MRSENTVVRERSGAEVAFDVMRALTTARLLWGRDGALPLAELPGLVQAPAEAVALTVDRLCDEGIAIVSEPDATVRVTDDAMRDLYNHSGAGAPACTDAPA